MVQTIKSLILAPSQKMKVAEMPYILHRIFFNVRVVVGVNTGSTVNRQFEKMEYIIGEGTPIKFKQK